LDYNKTLNLSHLFYALLFCLLAFTSCQGESVRSADRCIKNAIVSPKLISVYDALDKLYDPDYIFIEVSKLPAYLTGHIPNAIQIWRPDFRTKAKSNYVGMRCSATELSAFLQNLGVDSNSQLILYDAKGGCDAMRLAWVLDYYGYQSYQVLNGGKAFWKQNEFPLQTKNVIPKRNSNYTFIPAIDSSYLATKEDVIAALADEKSIIVDTRETSEHIGQCFMDKGKIWTHKDGAFSRGCIPQSVHLPWSDLSDLDKDHRIKCEKDLRHDLAQRGITAEKKIIVYCQSGSRSSHTAFVLREILKFPDVQNYDGSWIEWSYFASVDTTFKTQQLTPQKDFDLTYKSFSNNLNVVNIQK